MKDLTQGSISHHVLVLAAPVAVSMLTQIAYQLVDLYFITRISVTATAGVNAAGNAIFIVAGLAQVLSVGTAPLVAHAVGRKDRSGANLIFNQSLVIAAALALVSVVVLSVCARPYLASIAADTETIDAGTTFMFWVLPGYALMIPMAALGAALRGTGIVRPHIAIQMLTVVINAILAPILVAGWGTGLALGVQGAGLATSISSTIGVILLALYFGCFERYLTVEAGLLRPRFAQWGRILHMGLPAGCEFALTFLSTAVVYYTIRDFGAAVQAGFGIGSRVLQVILLPGLAIGFAVGPIAAQNFGAKDGERVRQTFYKSAMIGTSIMTATAVLVQWRSHVLLTVLDADDAALSVATLFLRLMSWTFIAQGLICICSGMFQGFGNTVPTLLSSGARFLVLSTCSVWLASRVAFAVEHVWHLLLVSILLQAIVSLYLLRRECGRWLPSAIQQPKYCHGGSELGASLGPRAEVEERCAGH